MLFYIIRIYLADKYNHSKMIIVIIIINNHTINTSSGLFNASILLFIQANICTVTRTLIFTYIDNANKVIQYNEKGRIMIKKSSRRRFLQLTAGGIIGLTLGNKLIIRSVHADELPHLEENNPQASTLKYVNNSKVKGQQCKNCLLIRNTSNDSDWQPCAIFPGKSVNMNGWCSAYAPKPA